jgi:outer membrane protein
MKKFLFIATALFALQFSNAQSFAKGDKFLEGTFMFKTSDAEDTFNFNPSVGYFLTDKFAVGANFTTETTKDSNGNKTNQILGASVFARCYFLNIGEHLRVHSQLGVGTSNDKITETSTTSATLGLGINYFISKNLSLTLNAADIFSYESTEGTDSTQIGFEGINNPFNVATLGLNYRF